MLPSSSVPFSKEEKGRDKVGTKEEREEVIKREKKNGGRGGGGVFVERKKKKSHELKRYQVE